MEKWRMDPALLKNSRIKVVNDLLDAAPGFVLHKKQIEQIYKEIGEIDQEIQKIQNKISMSDRYSDEIEKINELIEKNEEKCEIIKTNIAQKAMELFQLERGNIDDIANLQMSGMTPFVSEYRIRSLLLAQKVELKKLEYEYNKLKRNVFCIIDEDPANYQIDQPHELPDLYDDKFSHFNNIQSSIYADIELPISQAAKEITEILETIQTPEIDNGVPFTAAPTDYFDHAINSKSHQATDLTNKLDVYAKELSVKNDKTSNLYMKVSSEIDKANNFEVRYEEEPQARVAGAQYIRTTVQKIKHAQEVLDSLIRSIDNSDKFPPEIFEKENEIRNSINELIKALKERTTVLQKESDIRSLPLPQPAAQPQMRLKNISDLQIERVNNQINELGNSLIRKAVDIENLVTLTESEYEIPSSDTNDYHSTDFEAEVAEILRMQQEIIKAQDEQLNCIADIFDLIPDLKQYDVEWPDIDVGADDEEKVPDEEKVTDTQKNEESEKLPIIKEIEEMMSDIRSRQYTPQPPPPGSYPKHVVHERHPINELFEKWRSQNLEGVEATDIESIEIENERLRNLSIQLKEEVDAAQKNLNAQRREAAAREKRAVEIREAAKRAAIAEERANHARQTSDKINRIISKKAKNLQNVENRIASLNDDIYALKIEADLEEKERLIREVEIEIEQMHEDQ